MLCICLLSYYRRIDRHRQLIAGLGAQKAALAICSSPGRWSTAGKNFVKSRVHVRVFVIENLTVFPLPFKIDCDPAKVYNSKLEFTLFNIHHQAIATILILYFTIIIRLGHLDLTLELNFRYGK